MVGTHLATGTKGSTVNVTRHRLAAVVGLILLSAGLALAQASDAMVGTWKFNAEKSKGSPFVSGTSKIEKDGDGIKVAVDLMRADGTSSRWAFNAKYDGKDYPVTGDSPFGDAIALKRVDAHNYVLTSKLAGKVLSTQTTVISADGKTRTNTTKGKDAKGQPVSAVVVYDKE